MKRGTLGEPGQVSVNYLDVTLDKMLGVAYHYDVKITPECPKKLYCQAFEQYIVEPYRQKSTLSAILSPTECKTLSKDPDMLQRWNRALQAINDAERQRQEDKAHPNPGPEVGVRLQRPNDKRMRWRGNSKQLEDEGQSGRAAALYTSTSNMNAPNPSYLDVADYVRSEAPWWFN
ncbi:GL20374 [Drosophila persimilis]|uniref:GL20374 n=1 Tax=Drosophila persimilis TaxID=7234 RepID=B4GXZ0_DROPE|nr:GL20374 [Drosophila persimilis]